MTRTTGPAHGRAGPTSLHVEGWVEGLGPDGLDLAQHVPLVDLTPGRVDEAQRLTVVAPVRRVEAVGLLEVRDGVAGEAGPVQMLRELEVPRRPARTPADAAATAR